MDSLRMYTSNFRPKRESPAAESGKKPFDPQPGKPTSKEGLSPSNPGLQRTKSDSGRLTSGVSERPHIEPARPPVSRPRPDIVPPRHFGPSEPPSFFCIPLPSGIAREIELETGSQRKFAAFKQTELRFEDIEPRVRRDRELMKIIKESSPNYSRLNPQQRRRAAYNAIGRHPKFMAMVLEVQNKKYSIPTGATATRTMTPGEQTFLTNAFQKIDEDVRNKPFHIHGESSISGNNNGEITFFHHDPRLSTDAPNGAWHKYNLHTHPPYMEPATSSASVDDHVTAANLYLFKNQKRLSYVTNGKDVLHIQPDSTELVKLIPDPDLERTLGTFPVAFKVPAPQKPHYPFSNHEAPGAL
ncbi:MAG TPA: hypothetical protein VK465_03265 [Fibrobacteria bacterium]|nr:hypothetical protein [Fibrobacteria bacterium]